MNTKEGANIKSPIRFVEHSSFKKIDGSLRKSICPACDTGILPLRRKPGTLYLDKRDICLYCKQQFEYTDILKVRKEIG